MIPDLGKHYPFGFFQALTHFTSILATLFTSILAAPFLQAFWPHPFYKHFGSPIGYVDKFTSILANAAVDAKSGGEAFPLK